MHNWFPFVLHPHSHAGGLLDPSCAHAGSGLAVALLGAWVDMKASSHSPALAAAAVGLSC
jgi:hypothetical protein